MSVRTGGEQPQASCAVRNEGEAHPMSLDIFKQSVEPSRFRHGEGYQDWTLANPAQAGEAAMTNRSSHHHGGVGGHGMPVMVLDVRNEISADGRQSPTAGASGHTARPVWSEEKSERSIVATKAVTRPERRGRTWWTRTAQRRTR